MHSTTIMQLRNKGQVRVHVWSITSKLNVSDIHADRNVHHNTLLKIFNGLEASSGPSVTNVIVMARLDHGCMLIDPSCRPSSLPPARTYTDCSLNTAHAWLLQYRSSIRRYRPDDGETICPSPPPPMAARWSHTISNVQMPYRWGAVNGAAT